MFAFEFPRPFLPLLATRPSFAPLFRLPQPCQKAGRTPKGWPLYPIKVFSFLFEGETPLALRQFTPPKMAQSREPMPAYEAPRPNPPSLATRPSLAP